MQMSCYTITLPSMSKKGENPFSMKIGWVEKKLFLSVYVRMNAQGELSASCGSFFKRRHYSLSLKPSVPQATTEEVYIFFCC